jgi:hypothetical protein
MNRKTFREQLLSEEKVSPELRERYRKEVRNMLERKLTKREKIGWTFAIVLCCFFFVFFGYLALFSPPGFPLVGRIVFGLGPVFAVAYIALAVTVLRRGKLHRIRTEDWSAKFGYGFVLLLMVIALVWGGQMEDRVSGISMILSTLVFLILFGVLPMIINRVNRAEWKLREDLLRIELELAELREKVGKGREESD